MRTISKIATCKTASLSSPGLLGGAPLLLLCACATLSGARGGGGGSADAKQLEARNQALAQLEVEALKPCGTTGKPTDNGVFVVTAKPNGTVTPGAVQWSGTEELQKCLLEAISKSRLPAWSGPTVTWLWPVGTKEAPAPKALDQPPVNYRQQLVEHTGRAQGNAGLGSDTSIGPLSSCAQRSFSQESYALLTLRLFIFPDGKVVGATPVHNEGEAHDGAYMDCVADIVRGWTFDPFPGPGFTTLDANLKFGINPADK